MINKTFKHKHLDKCTCVVLAATNKGYKTSVTSPFTPGSKKITTKIQYFDKVDFDANKGFWIEENKIN